MGRLMVFLGVWQSRRISRGFRNGKVIEVFLGAKFTKLRKKMAIFPWFLTVGNEFERFLQSAQRSAQKDEDCDRKSARDCTGRSGSKWENSKGFSGVWACCRERFSTIKSSFEVHKGLHKGTGT
jgi:hypothetical protein